MRHGDGVATVQILRRHCAFEVLCWSNTLLCKQWSSYFWRRSSLILNNKCYCKYNICAGENICNAEKDICGGDLAEHGTSRSWAQLNYSPTEAPQPGNALIIFERLKGRFDKLLLCISSVLLPGKAAELQNVIMSGPITVFDITPRRVVRIFLEVHVGIRRSVPLGLSVNCVATPSLWRRAKDQALKTMHLQ